MADLRNSDIRQMDKSEQEKHLTEMRKNLMRIRGGLHSGGIPEDTGKTRQIRKTVARILTITQEEASKKK